MQVFSRQKAVIGFLLAFIALAVIRFLSYDLAPKTVQTVLDAVLLVIAFYFISRDVTLQKRTLRELHRAKESAESASRTKSLLLANMSHELRTPLNAIIGFSEMLLEEADPVNEQQTSDLKKIHHAGKQLLGLINDILDLSKIEAGKMSVHLETFDVTATICEVSATLKPIVPQNSNVLTVECPAPLGTMRADRSKVRQCLFNLLGNALKFTRQGTVTLRVERAVQDGRDWVTFTISDTGIGMTQEQLSNLFQPFAQAEASTSSKFGGTGLGLALSRQFSRIMGGDITVQSDLGKGSTFVMHLPAIVTSAEPELPAAAAAEVEEAAQFPALPGGKFAGRVLVIDDDPVVRELLGRTLAAAGLDVRSASTGEEGVRMARQWKPNAITLDVVMHPMDGWAVLRTLKNDPLVADVPVIMLSTAGDQDRALGIALGASEFLTKPLDRSRLARLLDKYRPNRESTPVLIVEDDADVREMLKRTLASEGWPVLEAENGRVALERVAAQRPGIILLDLMMPEMDGFEFMAEMHQSPEWRSIPIVVVTARDLTDEDHHRLNGNVEKILAKSSYSREDLLSEVSDMVKACCVKV